MNYKMGVELERVSYQKPSPLGLAVVTTTLGEKRVYKQFHGETMKFIHKTMTGTSTLIMIRDILQS